MTCLFIPIVAYGSSAPRYQVKPREDGRGPYRWSYTIKSGQGGLREGSIYRQIGDDLSPRDVARLVSLCKLIMPLKRRWFDAIGQICGKT